MTSWWAVIPGHMNLTQCSQGGEQEHITPMYKTVKQITLHCETKRTNRCRRKPSQGFSYMKETDLPETQVSECPVLDRQEEDRVPLREGSAQISLRLQHSVRQLRLIHKATFWPPITLKCWVLNPDAIFPENLGRQEVKMRRITVHKYIVVRKPDFTSSQENTVFCGQGGLCKTSLIIFGTRLCRIRNGI